MKCAQCGRPIKQPAAQIGRLNFGPTCAKRLGLTVRQLHETQQVKSAAERDPYTRDLFAEAA